MTPILNADLHCQSVVSDGTLTPEDLAARAKANGVELWALTDHDEVGGQQRAAAAARAGITENANALPLGRSLYGYWARADVLNALLGDGESEEGQVWEAAMFAGNQQLYNLCVIVDHNGLQIDGPTAKVMNSEPLDQKMDAFGFNTIICNGNSLADLEQAFILFDRSHGSGKPTCFLLHTTKGLGVSFMENAVDWHGKAPNDAEYDKAMAELRASYEVMEKEAERING